MRALSFVLLGALCLLVVGPWACRASDPRYDIPTTDIEKKYADKIDGWNELDLPSAKLDPSKPRPPGTLLLNMLIKNEADFLDMTLPAWAKIIDYWIIGVDDNNTDSSPEIIRKHLGHIPGSIVIVHFDGMGPTWTILVEEGLKRYPEATHGIIADADFLPMNDHLDKMTLDIRCSKHMYTIFTEDLRNERKMDWIYRNIPGVAVRRRTHQILEAPPLPDQEVFQTLIPLNVQEHEGGYNDRTGAKNERYIGFLEKDLAEYPNDTRTLYYLGYAHFDIYNQNKGQPGTEHWDHLTKGVEYFKRRVDQPGGNEEELWFTLLKLGEIYERFYNQWDQAEKYYLRCTELDPDRADAWFYLGQHYRLHQQVRSGLDYLKTAALLEMPERSLFQWHYLYKCLAKLEYGRAVNQMDDATPAELKLGKRILLSADCTEGDPGNMGEQKSLLDVFDRRLDKGGKGVRKQRVGSVKSLLSFISKNFDSLEEALDEEPWDHSYRKTTPSDDGMFSGLIDELEVLQEFVDSYKALAAQVKAADDEDEKAQAKAAVRAHITCRNYRLATRGYTKFWRLNKLSVEMLMDDSGHSQLLNKWNRLSSRVAAVCR